MLFYTCKGETENRIGCTGAVTRISRVNLDNSISVCVNRAKVEHWQRGYYTLFATARGHCNTEIIAKTLKSYALPC